MKPKDLTNKTFGFLTAVSYVGSKNYHAFWACRCECGVVKEMSARDLKREAFPICSLDCSKFFESDFFKKNFDLSGQRFGYFKVIKPIGYLQKTKKTRSLFYECACDCGKTFTTRADRIKQGRVQSCGCFHIERVSGENCTFYIHGLNGNADHLKLRGHKRRANVRKAKVEVITVDELKGWFETFDNCCVYCGDSYKEIDHVVPISKGGKHILMNLVPACRHCNRSKANKVLFKEWQPKSFHPYFSSKEFTENLTNG